ncbi:MAG TPA: isoprenylcysteine carboxylmethyltransferase family protein, partial [Terriglobia bacterium]|nr:isoprenylcysteine carboxylmethyltransferase family protein [Terriglobia bacterium]
YIGTLTVAMGLVIAARRWELGALAAAFFALIYLPVVELEEQYLREIFPAFPDYAARVPKLLPRAPSHAAGKAFQWRLYRHNREYEALLGFLAGLAVLFWKAFG